MVGSEADPAKRAGIRDRLWVIGRKEVSNQRTEVESRETRVEGRGLEGGAPISNQQSEGGTACLEASAVNREDER